MKIRLSRNRHSTTVAFHAENDAEGADLKDIVFGLPQLPTAGNVGRVIEDLGKKGYAGEITKETPRTKEFRIAKKERR